MASSAPLPRTPDASPLITVGATVTLTVSGEVDTLTAHILERAATNALRCAPPRLVLDLTEVTFLSASSVASLVRVRRAAHRHGTGIEIIHAAPAVTRVIAHADRALQSDPAFAQR